MTCSACFALIAAEWAARITRTRLVEVRSRIPGHGRGMRRCRVGVVTTVTGEPVRVGLPRAAGGAGRMTLLAVPHVLREGDILVMRTVGGVDLERISDAGTEVHAVNALGEIG